MDDLTTSRDSGAIVFIGNAIGCEERLACALPVGLG